MRDPIVGILCILSTKDLPAAIGNDRQLRSGKLDRREIGAEVIQDRIQHAAMGSDINLDPLSFDILRL